MTETAVLALGGNALIREDQSGTLEEQYANAVSMARSVRSLLRSGWRVVILHGNGPQVGNLAIQQECASEIVPALPLSTLGAMTQGQLGSLICLALNEVCAAETAGAVSVVTHVEIDPEDPALSRPTKPIGPFFTESEVPTLRAERGWTMVEDAGRGYRRVVPSPRPRLAIEASAIAALVDLGYLVVAGGGGGIPVVRSGCGNAFSGVDAVIDKDFAAERIADAVDAVALVMVTGVDAVKLDFGTPQERAVVDMSASEARRHLATGQFPPGSMGPKVQAAIEFIECPGRVAAITSPELVLATMNEPSNAVVGRRGTRIMPDASPVGA